MCIRDSPNNVVFETFLPGQTYNWSVTVDGVISDIWNFTVANKIHPLSDRSVDININLSQLYLSAISAIVFVPNILFLIASLVFFSRIGTCLYAAA